MQEVEDGSQIMIKVVSTIDKSAFNVSLKAANLSEIIRGLLIDVGIESEVPVKAKGETLKNVFEWLEHHKDEFVSGEDLKDEKNETKKIRELSDWENGFFGKMTDDQLVDIILVANLLDAKALLDSACLRVANFVRGVSPEELRKCLERTEKPIPEDLSAGIKNIEQSPPGEHEEKEREGKRKR